MFRTLCACVCFPNSCSIACFFSSSPPSAPSCLPPFYPFPLPIPPLPFILSHISHSFPLSLPVLLFLFLTPHVSLSSPNCLCLGVSVFLLSLVPHFRMVPPKKLMLHEDPHDELLLRNGTRQIYLADVMLQQGMGLIDFDATLGDCPGTTCDHGGRG